MYSSYSSACVHFYGVSSSKSNFIYSPHLIHRLHVKQVDQQSGHNSQRDEHSEDGHNEVWHDHVRAVVVEGKCVDQQRQKPEELLIMALPQRFLLPNRAEDNM